MPEYKATVIIPVYNVEKFVESCLVSLTGFRKYIFHKNRAIQMYP